MTLLGWTILTLVFVDELLVMAAYGVWGFAVQGVLLAVALLVFSAAINAVAQLRFVRELIPQAVSAAA